MRLTTFTFITLDGVAQAPGAPDEDRSGGFDKGGWLVPHFDDDVAAFVHGTFRRGDAYLLGRRTFDLFESFWPHADTEEDPVVAGGLNRNPKHVVSRTRTTSDWAGTTFHSDLRAAVEELKAAPGDEVQVHGSPSLVNQLAALDSLELISARTSGSGVVLASYRSTGEPTFGSIPPTE